MTPPAPVTTEEAIKVVDVLGDLLTVGDKVIEDKSGLTGRLMDLLPLVKDSGLLATTNFSLALQQFAGADDAQKAALLAEFGTKLQLASAPVASDIIGGLALGLELESFIAQFEPKVVAYIASLKAPAAPAAPAPSA